MEKIILLVVLAFHCVSAHKIYEDECPAVDPMPEFDITKVRGLTKSDYFPIYSDCID